MRQNILAMNGVVTELFHTTVLWNTLSAPAFLQLVEL